MKHLITLCLMAVSLNAFCQELVHPELSTVAYSQDSTLMLKLIGKKQNYGSLDSLTLDKDIDSPKSVNMHPDGTRYYVNSLEGGSTVVYDFKTNKKLKTIKHTFTEADSALWGNAEPFYEFKHYTNDLNTFFGKPVESTFSHGGRYLWVPYYRRSYDINAQDPSAVAIIDTRNDSIIRLMDTGPLPKMIATSPDGKYIAISQWGDNTVGIIDIQGDEPWQWKYKSLAIVDKKLDLNFSLTHQIDRDNVSGYCLRGTAFTPDNHYLLVGCMQGAEGIAIIDLTTMEYKGRVLGTMPNVRHIIIRNGYLYLSINRTGYIQRIPLDTFLSAIPSMQDKKTHLDGWTNCKVGEGARTIEMLSDGKYIFAACNVASALYVVDAESMTPLLSIPVDSYPVGLDVQGSYVFTTSQGRSNRGGNAVDIFEFKEIK